MNNRKKQGFTLIELVVVGGITLALVMLLWALVGQSRERVLQNRCKVNLWTIYGAIHEYADDYEGYICPYYDGGVSNFTWEELLRPYTYGGSGYYYHRTPEGRYEYQYPILFYYPKRYEAGQFGSNSGYMTNYTVNINVIGTPPRPPVNDPWNPNAGHNNPYPVLKFEDFQDHNNIAMIFESETWVIGNPQVITHPEWLDYFHYEKTHILMLNGTVRRFKE